MLEREAPTIFGDGEQSRDFTYVEDVAELNLKAARAKDVVGQHVQRRQRRPDHAEPGVGAAAEDRRRRDPADIRPAARGRRARFAGRYHARRPRLGHAPRFTFEEGMRLTLEWYRNNR